MTDAPKIEVCSACGRRRDEADLLSPCRRSARLIPRRCAWTRTLRPLIKNGARVAVGRPVNPLAHLAIARVAHLRQDPAILDSVLDEEFTFAGFVATSPNNTHWLVDDDGTVCGELQPGDSLLDERCVGKERS